MNYVHIFLFYNIIIKHSVCLLLSFLFEFNSSSGMIEFYTDKMQAYCIKMIIFEFSLLELLQDLKGIWLYRIDV